MTPEQKERMEENRVSNAKLAERLAAKKPAEAEPVSRIQQDFRDDADRKNPTPAATVLDSRGRPKEKSDNHKWLGQP